MESRPRGHVQSLPHFPGSTALQIPPVFFGSTHLILFNFLLSLSKITGALPFLVRGSVCSPGSARCPPGSTLQSSHLSCSGRTINIGSFVAVRRRSVTLPITQRS